MNVRAVAVPALLGLSLTAAGSGGWAVITVEDLPTHMIAGQPVELRFKVRQHGMHPMDDLKPTVTAAVGKEDVRVGATYKGNGVYAATITPPATGQTVIDIDGNWHAARARLLPVTTLAANTKAAPIPEHYRGKQLFVAKGCFTCHVHADVANSGQVPVGIDLTGKSFAPDYLKLWLANPNIRPPQDPNKRMPNLDLKPQEIAALVAFINHAKNAN